MSDLSEELRRALPDGWNPSRVADALDGKVHRATVFNYFNGKHPRRPQDKYLKALAEAIPGLTLVQLRRAADVPVGEREPYVPPEEADRLDEQQRAALDRFIIATVRATEAAIKAAHETGTNVVALPEPKTPRERLAARPNSDGPDEPLS